MDALFQDFRYALRALLRHRGFAAAAVLTFALGVGATTAIFSAVNAVLLKPLPYAAPEQLVRIYSQFDGERARVSPAEFRDYEVGASTLASIGGFAYGAANLTGEGEPERVARGFVTAALLPTLGTQPLAGRYFTADEDRPGAAPVVILTEELWRRRYGAERDIVNRTIQVDGGSATVVGILPAGFRLPDDYSTGEPVQVLAPMQLEPQDFANRGSHFLNVIARVRPGGSAQAATEQLQRIAREFTSRFRDNYPEQMHFGVAAVPLAGDVVASIRPALVMLLGAVAFVLLIACVNVANLLLARAEDRRREFAVRAALGAGRGQIVRQLLAEGLTLALLGGVLGLLFARWGTQALVALRPADMPRLDELRIDGRALLVAFTVSILSGVLFCLSPMLHLRGRARVASLREARGNSANAGTRRARSVLVGAEIALALVLLTGATLLLRTMAALSSVDPGYRTENVMTFRLSLPSSGYDTEARVLDFFPRLLDNVRGLPGVVSAGAVSNLPLESDLGDLNFTIEGRAVPPGATKPRADWQVVTPGYLESMDVRLVRGRLIDATDTENAPGVVVLSEGVARKYWPDQDALGQRMLLGGKAGPGWVTVIGIVRDVRHSSFGAEPKPTMYLSHRQFRFWNGGSVVRAMTVTVRTRTEPETLARALTAAVHDVDPQLPVGDLQTMEQVVGTSLAKPRFLMSLLGAFAIVALTLAGIGVYGIIAYTVRSRTREIGVRMALGAQPREILLMVVGQGARVATAGIVIGLVAAAVLTRGLSTLLYQVKPTDGITFVVAAGTLLLVALCAALLPARAASRVAPTVAIQSEA